MKDHSRTRQLDYSRIIEKLETGEVLTQDFLMDWYHDQRGPNAPNQAYHGCINTVMSSLGQDYPIFEPAPGSFKLLTAEDFAIYG